MGDNNKKLNRPKLWNTWVQMRQRCSNSRRPNWYLYGGRGIKVCKEWILFSNFQKDMLPSYKEGLTLDRIDNNGHYCKENCRWATKSEQANNRRTNRIIEINGIKRTMAQWIKESGLKQSLVWQRYAVYKWDIRKALNIY